MPEYLCLQRNLSARSQVREATSTAGAPALYVQLQAWRAKFRACLVDAGGRLGDGRVALAEPAPDGALSDVKSLVGYMIISATSLDEAVEVARECPGLVRDGSAVEVIEIRLSR